MIDPSLMTKFQKTRITEDILEEMIFEMIRQAIERGIIKSNTIIVDATHSLANVKTMPMARVVRELSKQFRREIYGNMPDFSAVFPEKPEMTATLDEEMEYTRCLLNITAAKIQNGGDERLKELHSRIMNLLEYGAIGKISSANDLDARAGHKSRHSIFVGYKNHIAMSEKSRNNDVEVKEIVGDMAYVSPENLEYCKAIEVELTYAVTRGNRKAEIHSINLFLARERVGIVRFLINALLRKRNLNSPAALQN